MPVEFYLIYLIQLLYGTTAVGELEGLLTVPMCVKQLMPELQALPCGAMANA